MKNRIEAPFTPFHQLYHFLVACGKPTGHREVAPREFDVHSRWKPEREAEKKGRRRRRRRRRKTKKKEEKKRRRRNEARAVDDLLTAYQMSTGRSI